MAQNGGKYILVAEGSTPTKDAGPTSGSADSAASSASSSAPIGVRPDSSPSFCGVCTTVHALAVRGVENALDLEIPLNAQYIRNLILIAHALHDHAFTSINSPCATGST